jgi:fructokinase
VILVLGEALIDLVLHPTGEVQAIEGGGPYNAARTIGRLGQPSMFMATISSDRFGQGLLRHLREDGVDLSAVVATDRPTTLAAAELDEDGSAKYHFYFEGTAAPALEPAAALTVLPRGLRAFHVGTLGLVLEPMATAAEAVLAALEPSTLVFVDPNCRPRVITDPAAYRERIRKLCRRADIVKVSDEDLEFLRPGIPAAQAAQQFIHDGALVVLLSAGAEGVRVFTASGSFLVPAAKVEVVDTIGAGDSLGGGFLAWWIARGYGRAELSDLALLRRGASFAAYVAGRTCAVAGAQPPVFSSLPPALQAELSA